MVLVIVELVGLVVRGLWGGFLSCIGVLRVRVMDYLVEGRRVCLRFGF